jgi:predicted transcriptional regulator
VECKVKNITKAGIHAEVRDNDDNVPIVIFVARDHNYTNNMFDNVEKDAIIHVKIIGVRFELNDPSITAIAYLLNNRERVNEFVQVNEVNEFVEPIEERYLKLKQEAEDEEKEEKKLKDIFGETGPVVYDEDAFNVTKKRKIIIRK